MIGLAAAELGAATKGRSEIYNQRSRRGSDFQSRGPVPIQHLDDGSRSRSRWQFVAATERPSRVEIALLYLCLRQICLFVVKHDGEARETAGLAHDATIWQVLRLTTLRLKELAPKASVKAGHADF